MNSIQQVLKKVKTKARRLWNNKCLYVFPPEHGGWTKQGALELETSGGSVFDPYVLVEDNIKLYYSNRKTNTIDLIESFDGSTWSKPISVFGGEKSEKWDAYVNRACVVLHNDQYKMWYTGQFDGKSYIGYAVSNDGKNFTRGVNEPVLIPELAYEKNSVMNPCVLWNKKQGLFQMWYAAGETYEPDNICYATSIDGKVWNKAIDYNPVLTKSKNMYDKCKVGGCDVHFINGKYVMYYIGYQNVDVARICVARSDDGLSWKRVDNNPILSPSKNGWDCDAVYKPCVAYYEGKKYMWYNGRKKNIEKLGLATKEDIM